MTYLTNIRLEDKARCEYAAKESGMDVEFRDYPMPIDHTDYDDIGYDPKTLESTFGSVFTNEFMVDHSPFWRAWEKYGEQL